MAFEERILSAYSGMSKSFIKLADFILDNYIEVSFMTATELAHAVDVDTTTVVRFSQQLGYLGYPSLLRDIREKVKAQILVQTEVSTEVDSTSNVVENAMRNIGDMLARAHRLLEINTVETLANKIGASRRIFILPDELAQPAAYTLLNLLERGGFVVSVVRNSINDLARTVQMATPEDLLLSIEVVGESPYIARALAEAREAGIPTGAIVGAASLETSHIAELVLSTQTQPSSELSMVLVNAVVYALGQVLRWRYADRFAGVDRDISALFVRLHGAQAE